VDLSVARDRLANLGPRPFGPGDVAVDGLVPSLVLEPEGDEQAAEALAFCESENLAVVPVGAGTRLNVGNLPSRLDVYLSTRRLSGVGSYEPGDLTMSAAAGTPIAVIQEAARRERQFLPLDPPGARVATIGGVLAAGDPGWRRRPGARPRDVLLGVGALLPKGTRFKSGGRVVKNVAGYELTKLLVGSLGSLALLTEVHLRLRPCPETTLTLGAAFRDAAAAAAAARAVRRSRRDPEAFALLNPALGGCFGFSGFTLLARLEGMEEEVRAESAALKELVRGGEAGELSESRASAIWEQLRDFALLEGPLPAQIVLRVQALPAVALTLLTVREADWVAANLDSGWVYVRSLDEESYRVWVAAARGQGAAAVLEHGPPAIKEREDVFSALPQALPLMRGIKQAFDPGRILSPGRFVGRL
jgi:glycolate oxidase FAD binding subunit